MSFFGNEHVIDDAHHDHGLDDAVFLDLRDHENDAFIGSDLSASAAGSEYASDLEIDPAEALADLQASSPSSAFADHVPSGLHGTGPDQSDGVGPPEWDGEHTGHHAGDGARGVDDGIGSSEAHGDGLTHGDVHWSLPHDAALDASAALDSERPHAAADVPTLEFGSPGFDAACWHHQEYPFSCAVVAQTSVLEAITGQHLDEQEACAFASQHHWLSEDGTYPQDVGKFLDACGIPTHTSWHSSVTDIAGALAHGDKVIVGLNANEIWSPIHDPKTGAPLPQTGAGHTVWVTGIDVLRDGSVQVVMNDSGTPNGAGQTVALVDFMQAWSEFGNQLIVAARPSGPTGH